MIFVAFVVDAAIYAALGSLIVWLGRRWFPDPWGQPSFMIPLVIGIGLLLSLATFPHWLVRFE